MPQDHPGLTPNEASRLWTNKALTETEIREEADRLAAEEYARRAEAERENEQKQNALKRAAANNELAKALEQHELHRDFRRIMEVGAVAFVQASTETNGTPEAWPRLAQAAWKFGRLFAEAREAELNRNS